MATSAVDVSAAELGLRVEKPATLAGEATRQMLRDCRADVMVVVAYGKILPPAVLDIPLWGCLNIHASLLPRWRGAAPIQRAIEAGDTETGICVMQMDAGLDTGPVLLERREKISPDDTSATLFARLAVSGAAAIVEALDRLGSLPARPQPVEGVTYANKITKSEAQIDWSLPAARIERKIRAFDPFPGCESIYESMRLKIWSAKVVPGNSGARPGTILRAGGDGIAVQCGDGALLLTKLQKPGGRRIAAAELLAGMRLACGEIFT